MDQPNTMLAKIGSVIGMVGLISSVIATVLDYWFYVSASASGVTAKAYFGLWELCTSLSNEFDKSQNTEKCITFSKLESASPDLDITWLHACQAFMIIACTGLGVGLCLAVLFAFKFKSSKQMMFTGGLMCLISGSFALVAAGIFAAKYEDSVNTGVEASGSLHAGFGLAVVTIVLAKVAGIVILRNRVAFYASSYP